MESRDPMGIPPPAAVSIGSGSGSFGAMPQSGMGPPQGGSPSTGLPASPAPPPGLHAPAAMRPASVPLVTVVSNNSNSGPEMSTAILPVAMPVNTSMGMSIGMGVGVAQPVKRKRGRPRKYGPDGSMALALAPLASASPLSPSQKRGRGRPPGSGRKQQLAALGGWMAGSAGLGFTPHVITIAAGEDVATKVMSFSQLGPRAICILSANGAISNVTLRQPAISGGTVTYEGRFEILSLSGSFLLTETGGTRSRTGGLSVSLAGPDGRVVGGGVAGLLVAATPVQLIVGSFLSNGRKTKPRPENVEASTNLSQGAHPTMNDASGAKSAVPDSPVNQNTGAATSGVAQQSQGQSMATPIQAKLLASITGCA